MKKWLNKWMILIMAAMLGCLLSACTVHSPKENNIQDEITKALNHGMAVNNGTDSESNKAVPRAINASLIPNLRLKRINVNTRNKRFDISVKAMPVNDFFQGLVKGTHYNVIVSPKVTGNITIALKNVTIPEAIDATCQAYNYGYKQTEFGYHILPDALETQMFTVNYLDINRRGISETSVTASQLSSGDGDGENGNGSGGSRNGSRGTNVASPASSIGSLLGGGSGANGQNSSNVPGRGSELQNDNNSAVRTTQQSDFWTTLNHTLHTIIGKKDGRKVMVNPQAGVVIVRAYPNELRQVAHYLDSTQNILDRQVILEAKVMEVALNATYQSGINWNILGLAVDNTTLANTQLTDFSGIFSATARAGNGFNVVMQLLGTQGRVQVLSSPRIATLNNQKAIIKVGGDQFFVTDIADTTTAGTIAGNNTQDIELTPFFSGIALDVTPQIGPNGNITLHIHPIVSRVEEDQRKFTVSNKEQDLPLAKTTVRESDSVVKAKDGQVIVIGGLMEDLSNNNVGTTPGVDQTVFKPLFSRNNFKATKNELVILLRARIVRRNSWNRDMKSAQRGFNTAKPSFQYTVSKPKGLFPKPRPAPQPQPKMAPAPKPVVQQRKKAAYDPGYK
ncbi:MAG: secretin N-terminal domain-containing protein [Coxiellaceae bacterium]|nr:secretin N-terminal domain-containing protein [Coxiellaceae bacterium]